MSKSTAEFQKDTLLFPAVTSGLLRAGAVAWDRLCFLRAGAASMCRERVDIRQLIPLRTPRFFCGWVVVSLTRFV